MKTRNTVTRSLGHTKAHFAEYVRAAENGQAVVLTRHGRPVARLVPFEEPDGNAEWAPGAQGRKEAGEVRERLAEYEERVSSTFSPVEARRTVIERLLENEIWPQLPRELIGKGPSKREREEILGIGEDGT